MITAIAIEVLPFLALMAVVCAGGVRQNKRKSMSAAARVTTGHVITVGALRLCVSEARVCVSVCMVW